MTKARVSKDEIRIMVVDDFPAMRKIIMDQLVSLGISGKNIVQMKDGKEAYEALLQGDSVDLIISDWLMPNKSGIEFLRDVRKNPGLKDIPFIMLTSEGQKEQVVQAIQEKVNGYIVKPLAIGTLAAKLNSLFPRTEFKAEGEN